MSKKISDLKNIIFLKSLEKYLKNITSLKSLHFVGKDKQRKRHENEKEVEYTCNNTTLIFFAKVIIRLL